MAFNNIKVILVLIWLIACNISSLLKYKTEQKTINKGNLFLMLDITAVCIKLMLQERHSCWKMSINVSCTEPVLVREPRTHPAWLLALITLNGSPSCPSLFLLSPFLLYLLVLVLLLAGTVFTHVKCILQGQACPPLIKPGYSQTPGARTAVWEVLTSFLWSLCFYKCIVRILSAV